MRQATPRRLPDVTQPSHLDISVQITRLAAILEPIPLRLDKMEEKWSEDIYELRKEISSLKEQRSHFMGIGVGVGAAFTFIAGMIATFGRELILAFIGKGPA